MSASDVSPPFHQMSHLPLTLAAGRFLVVGVWFACVFVCFLSPVLQVSSDFTIPPRVLDLDDRQGFTARSALR